MLVFGTQLHLLTLIFILLELMLFGYQFVYYLYRPEDKKRLYYLVLLKLMLFYNIAQGLFPDPHIRCLPVRAQEIIHYGLGFFTASYFPFYFYRALDIKTLRRHVRYYVPLCLIAPYLLFFVLDYSLRGDLTFETHYGLIGPFLYAPFLLYAIFRAIRDQYTADQNRQAYRERLAVYLALSPWAALTFFGLIEQNQVAETLCTNTGIVVISVLFINKSVRRTRREFQLLAAITLHGSDEVFRANSRRHSLSKREIQIVPFLIEGRSYKEIAEKLFISERTVDTHVRNIYRKCKVNSKIALLNLLYQPHPEGITDS